MQPRSKRERFYQDVGVAMSMTSTRSFINLQTLEIEFDASEMNFLVEEEEDEFADPDKYMQIETATSSDSFRVMEDFIENSQRQKAADQNDTSIGRKKAFCQFQDSG